MTRLEDVPEKVDPLLRLAATALARNPSAELKLSQLPSSPEPSPSASPSNAPMDLEDEPPKPKRHSPQPSPSSQISTGPALPLPCSQALFDALREASDAQDEVLDTTHLNTFLDGARFPLENLNLEGCARLSDKKLCRLLRAQYTSLRSLNISGCEGLTHRLSGQLGRLRMERLGTLTLGYSHHLLGSWFDDTGPVYDSSIFSGVEMGLMSNTGSCSNCGQATGSLSSPSPGPPSNPTTSSSEDAKDPFLDADLPGPSHNGILRKIETEADVTHEELQVASTSSDGTVGDEGEEKEDPTWTDLSFASKASPPSLTALPVPMEEEEEDEFGSQEDLSNLHRMLTHFQKRFNTSRPGQEAGMSPPLTTICPNLHTLICYGFSLDENQFFKDSVPNVLRNLLCPLKKLGHLDLSYWEGLEDGRFLRPHSGGLSTLILYNVPNLYEAIDTITELKHLVTLDISQGKKDTGIYPKPVTTLHNIVRKLRNLRYLDISSTNLASPPSSGDSPCLGLGIGGVRSDIVGLRPLTRNLDFLGLYNCETAARCPLLPANRVTGDANEGQVLLALETYLDRQELLRDVLNEVYTVYRFGGQDAAEGVQQTRALHLVLEAMRRYLNDATTQIAGSASLFYIIKPVEMRSQTRQKVVRTLLSGMEEHMEEQVMVRNCCLSLCQVDIPGDVLFDYQRAARLLIAAVNSPGIDDMTQKVVVYLLNSMACHVEGEQKSAVGAMGAVEAVLRQIRRRVEEGNCDEVMEVAWSFLWNITDETPGNCERFLAAKGLDLFHSAYLKFPAQKELVRNMMGLMGNIAEVAEQRAALRKPAYIRIFVELLRNLSDGIEISYNSAGVLAHILSEAEVEWAEEGLSREDVGAAVVAATKEWDLRQKRFINYRSFGPILRLLRLDEFTSPASLHWGVWALANLTTVDGNKYCEFVRREGGEPLLEAIFHCPDIALVTEDVKELAKVVRTNIHLWSRNELPQMDETDDATDEDMEV